MRSNQNNQGTGGYIQVRPDDWENLNKALRYLYNQVDGLSGRRGTIPQGSDLDLGGHKAINAADPATDTDLVTKQYADATYGPQTIRQQLSITGSNPALPNPLLGQGSPVFLEGLHSARPAAAAYGVGSAYYETDRTVNYINKLNASAVQVWTYNSGIYTDVLANQPADLAINDTGFRFTATDTAQHFRFNGTIFVEEYEVDDAVTAAVTPILNLIHRSSGTPTANFGAALEYVLDSSAKVQRKAGFLDFVWLTATDTLESSNFVVRLMNAGATAAEYFRVMLTGIKFKIGGFFGIFTHANAADRTYTFPDATGNITYETAVLTNNNFLFGGGGPLVKDAGFAIVPAANGGTGVAYNRIADTIALTNQSANIGNTGINNTGVAGTYRISISLEDTAADITAGAVQLFISWTDDAGATNTSFTQVLTSVGRTTSVLFLQSTGPTLLYSVSHTGIFGTAKYSLYIGCERLS